MTEQEFTVKDNKNMQINFTKDRLPADNQYVLAHITRTNWSDDDDPHGKRFWKVLKFKKGLSLKERDLLGTNPRKRIFYPYDEHDNNEVPYCWDEFGGGKYFGQEVDRWTEDF